MTAEIYHVIMPSGETRGPLSLKEIKEQALDGVIPRDAKVQSKEGTFTIFEMVALALGHPSTNQRQPAPEDLAILAGTQASTPRAKKKLSNNED